MLLPLFNQHKVSPGLAIADDTDILHFLDPDNSDKYVDARTALSNAKVSVTNRYLLVSPSFYSSYS